jgi:hypothetical protein
MLERRDTTHKEGSPSPRRLRSQAIDPAEVYCLEVGGDELWRSFNELRRNPLACAKIFLYPFLRHVEGMSEVDA